MQDDDEKKNDKGPGSKVESLLFKSRNVIITGTIDDKLAYRTVSHLLALAEEN